MTFGHPNADHYLMGTHSDFMRWLRGGAIAGLNRVAWLDNPFVFHHQREFGRLVGATPNGLKPGEHHDKVRASGLILLAPSWYSWLEIIGIEWEPWSRGTECALYTWNGRHISVNAWPNSNCHIEDLSPHQLKLAVDSLGCDSSPLERLRARYRIKPVE